MKDIKNVTDIVTACALWLEENHPDPNYLYCIDHEGAPCYSRREKRGLLPVPYSVIELAINLGMKITIEE